MGDLGISIDDEAAAAADAFGDQMDVLGMQIAGVGRTIGTALMPEFTRMANDISQWLASNKDEVAGFAQTTATLFGNFIRGLNSVKNWLAENGDTLRTAAALLTAGSSELLIKGVSSYWNTVTTPRPAGVGEASRTAKSGTYDRDALLGTGRAARSDNSAARKADAAQREAEARARREDAAAIRIALNNITAYSNELSDAIGVSIAKFEQFGNVDELIAEVGKETARLTQNIVLEHAEITKLEDKVRATNTAAENRLLTQAQGIRLDNAKLDLTKESARVKAAIAVADQKADLEAAARVEKAIEQAGIQLDQERERLRLMHEQTDAMIKSRIAVLTDGATPNGDGKAGETAYNPFQSWIDGYLNFIKTVQDSAPSLTQTIQGIGGMVVNAFQGMTAAIGGVVENWVLMGSTGPAVMRKILATALASIAAEAAVRAIWELALGFATLFTNPAESSGHFIAAALFGSVAVGSALAGRAVAGNSFKQQNQAATGGGGSGGGSNALSGETRYTTEFGGYGTGQNPLHALIKRQNDVLARVDTSLVQVEETIHQFNRKVTSMPASDIVAIGASDASREIRQAYESELSSNVGATDRLMRATGGAR